MTKKIKSIIRDLINEQEELNNKIINLNKFLKEIEKIKDFDIKHKDLLNEQLKSMNIYYNILEDRIYEFMKEK